MKHEEKKSEGKGKGSVIYRSRFSNIIFGEVDKNFFFKEIFMSKNKIALFSLF